MKNPPELGKLAPDDSKRDAIHVAVAPVEAACVLLPGQRVALNDEGKAVRVDGQSSAGKAIGIVDPFLDAYHAVRPGERFWLCLFPSTITSLRHEWTHPAFGEEKKAPAISTVASESELWLRDLAERCGLSYARLIEVGHAYIETGDWHTEYGSSDARDAFYDGDTAKEFWRHFQAVTGRDAKKQEESGAVPFSCSC